jgi:serine/threonine protein kinase
LFPGEDETEQLACIMEILGKPSPRLLEEATRARKFFESDGSPKISPNSRGVVRTPGSKSLGVILQCRDEKFIDFLKQCLDLDPRKRINPFEALQHDWILDATVPKSTIQVSVEKKLPMLYRSPHSLLPPKLLMCWAMSIQSPQRKLTLNHYNTYSLVSCCCIYVLQVQRVSE